jgi:hypothetical protein
VLHSIRQTKYLLPFLIYACNTAETLFETTKSKSQNFDHGVPLTNSIFLERNILFIGGTHTLQINDLNVHRIQLAFSFGFLVANGNATDFWIWLIVLFSKY